MWLYSIEFGGNNPTRRQKMANKITFTLNMTFTVELDVYEKFEEMKKLENVESMEEVCLRALTDRYLFLINRNKLSSLAVDMPQFCKKMLN